MRPTDAPTLRAGLEYLARGWAAMAVPEGSKTRVRPWKKWQRRRATPNELRADFAAEGGNPNVAVGCGKVSGLAVLDTDGRETEALVEGLNLPTTLTVRTMRGRHRYFHHAGPLVSRSLRLPGGDAIELRADGESVLAPPAVHPSGLIYCFEDPDTPLAELPQRVMDLFPKPSAHSMPANEGPPQRWLQLVAQYPSVRAVWKGEIADHPDRSGSGRDMTLAHCARRYHFAPEEVTAILLHAPWPVAGGRTTDYLRRTVEKAFASGGTRPRPHTGFGQFPAWVVTSGAMAQLSERAKAVLPVLVVRAERPSFIVRISMRRMAAEARVSEDRIGKATDELAEAGVIRKGPAPGGRRNLWLQMTPPLTTSAGSAEDVDVGEADATSLNDAEAQSAYVRVPRAYPMTIGAKATPPAGSAEHVNRNHSAGSAEHVLSDHEWREDPGLGLSPGRSLLSQGVEAAGMGKVRASMRLDSEMSSEVRKRVYQVQADGSRKPVWEGGVQDWLNWTPPDSLREAVVQDAAPLVKTDPNRRCEATTRAGLVCVGRPLVGSQFCKRHQMWRERACAPVA
ncbi:MAG: bifunctional DNA primase/polymerase [candidate division NC10 bacterium]|nr:bifunctional DNA primase/polymerase [candidate division NC10 bacterium]